MRRPIAIVAALVPSALAVLHLTQGILASFPWPDVPIRI